jgi:hypothetical protein
MPGTIRLLASGQGDMTRFLLALAVCLGSMLLSAPPAHADLCPYPGVGVAANVIFGRGGYCDYPTEINGSHMHCEAGGAGLGGNFGLAGVGDLGTASLGLGGFGAGGASCTWRCPDNTLAPQPNPPGAWKNYLIVMDSTNFCKDHMTPAGPHSAPVLPTEGVPGELPNTLAPGVPGP